jgi:pimeloyl-ACP methyl ester carboxylesterase
MMRKILKIVGVLLLILFVYAAFNYQADVPVEKLKGRYAQPPSQFVDLMGMQVHYRDEGPPADSIPIVLLHGTSSFLQTWDACTAVWSKNTRVIRMDLPAFGLTGPIPSGDYSLESYVSFLHAFLAKLNITSCYLAGNSLGGSIAYTYAATYPEQVKKLILIDPAGYPIIGAKGALAFKMARMPVVNNLFKVLTPRNIVRKSLEDVYGNSDLVTDSLVEMYRDMTIREGNRAAMIKRLNMPQSADTLVIKTLTMPTLVIWGDQDQLIPVSHAYKFQRDLPNDSLVILPGVGHVPMEETPGIVIPMVMKFIDDRR